MTDYQKLYHIMFNAATDALEALEQMNLGTARETLRTAQQTAEELYLGMEEAAPAGRRVEAGGAVGKMPGRRPKKQAAGL